MSTERSMINEVDAVIRKTLVGKVAAALHALPHFPGMTMSECRGQGRGRGPGGSYQPTEESLENAGYVRVEVLCAAEQTDAVIDAIRIAAHTGHPGDGLIVVRSVDRVVRVRTGDEQLQAL